MALTTNTKVWKVVIGIFLVLTAFFWLLFYFRLVFITLIVGISLIVLTEELVRDFRKRADARNLSRDKRIFYGVGIIVFWIFTISILFGLSITSLAGALIEVREANMTFSDIVSDRLEPFLPGLLYGALSDDSFEKVENYLFSVLANLIAQISSFLLFGVVIIPLMFYMYFNRKDELIGKFASLIPRKFSKSFHRATRDIGIQMYDFLKGKVIQIIILSTLYSVGFFVAGVEGWLVFGFLAGFLNIVPYIGPVIGAIPPLIVTLLVDEPIALVYVFIVVVMAQIVDNLYLQPFMISGKVKIDPLLSLVLLLVGARLYGAFGMIFVIPVYIVYRIVLKESYRELVRIYR
jgi:predicted PurR-regulated permease PerM